MANGFFQQSTPSRALAVTLSDSAANEFSMLYVGTTGDVKVTTRNGDVVTFKTVPAGAYVYVQTSLVWSTGTTASNIVGIG